MSTQHIDRAKMCRLHVASVDSGLKLVSGISLVMTRNLRCSTTSISSSIAGLIGAVIGQNPFQNTPGPKPQLSQLGTQGHSSQHRPSLSYMIHGETRCCSASLVMLRDWGFTRITCSRICCPVSLVMAFTCLQISRNPCTLIQAGI